MMTDPDAPLRNLLDTPCREDAEWRQLALAACAEASRRIREIRDRVLTGDRDTGACLDAVCASLDWIQEGAASSSEITRVVHRVHRIFEDMTVVRH